MVKEDLGDVLVAKVKPTAMFEEQCLHRSSFAIHCSRQELNAKMRRTSWKARPAAHSRCSCQNVLLPLPASPATSTASASSL